MAVAKKTAKAKSAPKKNVEDKQRVSEAYDIVSALRRPFKDRDDVWPNRRRVRDREDEPPIPEAYAGTTIRHKSSELDFMVNQIVSLLSENPEQYVVYGMDETEEMNRLSDQAQEAVSSLMEHMEGNHPIERHRLLIHDYQVADGVGIEKLTFNWDFYNRLSDGKADDGNWKEAFQSYIKENKELPIKRAVIDPLTCYWEFDVDGLVAVAEYGAARRSALKDTYGDDVHIVNALSRIPMSENTNEDSGATIGGIGYAGFNYGDPGDLVTVIEVWTRKEFMLIAEGDKGEKELLIRQKHPFKRPPYFFAPGRLTGNANPLHKYKPIVGPMYQTTQELSMVRSARFNAAYLSSFKPFYIEYPDGRIASDQESGVITMNFLMPGNEIPSIKGGKIVPLDWTNLDDLQNVEMSLMGDRDRFGFQAILAGNQAASGDSTAWETRMLKDQGMIQFNQVLRNFAQMREEEIYFIVDIVRRVLKDDLPIITYMYDNNTAKGKAKFNHITMKMADAHLGYQVRVNAGKASDRIPLVEEYRRAHEAGEVPMRMVLEEGWGFQNVGEIMDEVTDEMIRQQLLPKAMEIIMQVATAGTLDSLRSFLPDQAAPDPNQLNAQQAEAAAIAPPGTLGGEVPGQINPGEAPGGEIPGGIAEAGMGQGLVPQGIPPEESMANLPPMM